MKKISARAMVAVMLACVMLAGLGFFVVEFFLFGEQWATSVSNPHVYNGTNIAAGRILDSAGDVLMDGNGDGRVYNSDPTVRAATLHAVGDIYGNIETGIQSNYSSELVSYGWVNGVYTATGKGNDLYLTLNAQVCAAGYEAMAGRKGAIGVYNYKTGEIICMVSAPAYDPENVPDIENDETGAYEGVYLNRFLSGLYVPGSIFKVLTSTAAIETVGDIFTQSFYCDGDYDVGADSIICSGVHGTINFERALAVSCNCSFAQIAQQLGADTLTEYAVKAGLTSAIEFDGISTAAGSFDLSGAAESQVAWSAIGQYNDLINPCAYMTFIGSIANGGELVYPHLLDRIETASGTVLRRGETVTGQRVMGAETAETLGVMMRNNVNEIYGAYNYPDLYICAKSGTAEVGGGLLPHATFAGFLKDEEHPLAFIVIVENGGDGSSISGKVANAVLQKAVEVMDSEKLPSENTIQ